MTRLLKTVFRSFQSELGISCVCSGLLVRPGFPKQYSPATGLSLHPHVIFRATWCYQASHSSFRRPPEIAVPGAGAGDGQSDGQSQMPSGQMLQQDEVLGSFDCNMQWAVTTSGNKCIGYSLAIVDSRRPCLQPFVLVSFKRFQDQSCHGQLCISFGLGHSPSFAAGSRATAGNARAGGD